MNTTITKAVFPVAGLGTRFLPATKASPKEMLNVVDKPLIQYAVEEAMACGIGVCMTCVLPVSNEDGTVSMLRSCIDGPVMDGSKVQWQQVGTQL